MKKHSLNQLFSGAIAFLLALSAAAQTSTTEPQTVQSLQQRIAKIVDNPRYAAALFGVKIVSLDSGKLIYEHDSGKLCSPASNSKLYTMAMVLDRLGADYRIKTSLYAQGKPDQHGVIQGDLVIYGRGDPTINEKLPEKDTFKALEPLAAVLTNAGVKEISGDLVGDDSYYHGPPFGASWDWEDFQEYYGAEVSALTINSNALTLVVKPGKTVGAPCELAFLPETSYVTVSNRTHTTAKGGSKNKIEQYRPVGENVVYLYGDVPIDAAPSYEDVTMHDPAGLFADLFQKALATHGIKLVGHTRSMHWKDREVTPLNTNEWVELGSVESLPVRDIIREVQKPSQNLYTDLMLAHVGAHFTTREMGPMQTTEEAGLRELNKFLTDAGIKRGNTIFDEGSGLSRDNLTTPNATVTLLTYMRHHKDGDIYVNALPIAGVDGTLRRRMKGTAAENNLRAKTGTLRWTHSMSGYVTTAAGEHLVFSMMLNRYNNMERDRASTADLDAIGVMLAGFTGRTGEAAK